MIAYLRTLSGDPAPLPSAEAAVPEAATPEAVEQASGETSPEPAAETATATAEATDTTEATGGTETAAEGAAAGGFAALVASGDVAAGEKDFRKCAACHTVEEGGANKVGPNLWNVVNRPVAAHEDYKYSPALQEFAAGGAVWDYDNLSAFLQKPKDLVKGTKMSFAGIRDDEDRANMVAYLRSLASEPAPLP
ncbi:cytochrome c family protein [Oricola cellulosilytica]|uniref:Cytochrome c family protein n=2 Tax=Oricola cellulosilytica TaxID=1429082 RepID=A0A4R0PGL0_9HYPH|nr:cytochrome c family protein [Oricola cellulosilytica]